MRRLVAAIVLLIGCLDDIVQVRAETLTEALTAAYLSNPQLLARRAQGRAVHEGVPQALANWRPSLTLDLRGGRGRYKDSRSISSPEQICTPRSGSVGITQPLYRGGRTTAATREAEAKIRAEWAQLVNVEQMVLRDAAQAYLDVVRDKAVLKLDINNERVLQRQLEATRDRFRVGEITQTDVAQAEARLARATAAHMAAEGTLQSSRATYERVIGTIPGNDLAFPPSPPNLPGSLPEATEAAVAVNPLVNAAEYTARAAQNGVERVYGELRPAVNLEGRLSQGWDQASRDSRTKTAEIMVTVSVPLYQQGTVHARLREAKHTAGQRQLESDQARRAAVESATQAWEEWRSTRAQIESFQAQITAAEVALEGVKREAQVGSRIVLDVLNAEQELVDAKVALVRARRDELHAEYQLLTAIGRMTAKALNISVDIYDPNVHYRAIRDKWFGTSTDAEQDAQLSHKMKHP